MAHRPSKAARTCTFTIELDASTKAASADGPGEWSAVLSAPVLDRDNEVIAGKAFAADRPLPAIIPIHVDHDMSVRGLVGSARPYYDGDILKASGTFASTPYAQTVRTMVLEGHLRTMSVGFMSPRVEMREGKRTVVSAELLEGSFVTVPSNRDALVDSAKQYGERRDVKAIAGSYESLAADLQSALRGTFDYAYVLATFPDRVVFESVDRDTYEWVTYQAGWSRDDAGTLSISTPERVQILEQVAPIKTPAVPAAAEAAAGTADVPTALAYWRASVASSMASI